MKGLARLGLSAILIGAGGFTFTTGIGNIVVACGGEFIHIPKNDAMWQWFTAVACLVSGLVACGIGAKKFEATRSFSKLEGARRAFEARQRNSKAIRERAEHNKSEASHLQGR